MSLIVFSIVQQFQMHHRQLIIFVIDSMLLYWREILICSGTVAYLCRQIFHTSGTVQHTNVKISIPFRAASSRE